ncbi:MAG: DegT/DnrJ/EryC1/StrS family aminotransferase, partial [Candidatus Latescibacterota bacterium]
MSGTLAINGGTPVRDVNKNPWPIWPRHNESERQAVMRVADSGHWQMGPEVAAFEEQFADYVQAKHAICVMNGTVTMEIGLRAFGVGAGDEVIIPAHTFIATALAVLMVNATPVFVDSEPEHYNIDPEAVEKAVTERTRAIIPVHIGGAPCDMDAILDIARRHDLHVLEDAAHAHGSEWKGRRIGAISELASFSFQTGKVITAGDGGALTTDDDDLAGKCRSLRQFGYGYKEPLTTSNYRLTEFQGALLQVQLGRLDEQTRVREENARYLGASLSQIEGV